MPKASERRERTTWLAGAMILPEDSLCQGSVLLQLSVTLNTLMGCHEPEHRFTGLSAGLETLDHRKLVAKKRI
jgi:hypothetical protein